MKLFKTNNKYLTTAKIIVLALVLSAGISVVYGWTGPTAAPFGNNVPAPMNLGVSSQTKIGFGWFAGLGSTLGAFINGLLEAAAVKTGTIQVTGGSPAAQKILMATDNQGNTTWSDDLPTGFLCAQRVRSGVGTVESACQAGEALTGGGAECQTSLKSSAPGPFGNEWRGSCQTQVQNISVTAMCCRLVYPI